MLHTVLHPGPDTGPDAGTEPPLMIAHGLFGSARNWGAIARRLSDARTVVAVDMRNHGDSPRTARQTYAAMADDLAEVITAHGGVADVLGHSMGGKAAMQLALTDASCLRRVIVADIAPVAYAHDQTPLVAALQDLDLAGVTTRGAADASLAPAVPDPALRAFLLQSLDLKTAPPEWKLNLPVLAADMAQVVGWPGTPGRFDGPALFLAGADSRYVRPEHHAAILTQFPAAVFTALQGAGHWLHAEQPRAFEAAVRAFLA